MKQGPQWKGGPGVHSHKLETKKLEMVQSCSGALFENNFFFKSGATLFSSGAVGSYDLPEVNPWFDEADTYR